MSELEKIVADMETGELNLEESLKAFERGIALVNESQNKLHKAEQKVQILTQKNGEQALQPFDSETQD